MAIERTNLNIIKGMCDKCMASIIPSSEKPSISSTIRKKTHSSLLFTQGFGTAAMAITEEKEIKGIQIEKEVKPSLFADDMNLYIENCKYATRGLLELINKFSRVARYKINTEIGCISIQ